MWASSGRIVKSRVALGITNVAAFGFGALVYATGEIRHMVWIVAVMAAYYGIARYGFRCERCGKSPLLWSVWNSKFDEVLDVLSRPDCPYCRYDK